jgi:CheY-like chemotaxis protein
MTFAFAASDSPRHQPKLLLVDDDPLSLALTSAALRQQGFEVEEAKSAVLGLL